MPLSTSGKLFFGALAANIGVKALNKFLDARIEQQQTAAVAAQQAEQQRSAWMPKTADQFVMMLRGMVSAGDHRGFVMAVRSADPGMSTDDMTRLWEALSR